MVTLTLGSWTIIGLMVCGFLWGLWNKYKGCWDFKISRAVEIFPGPYTVPLIGCWGLVGSPEHVWNELRKCAKEYPRIYRVWGGNKACIMLHDPYDIEVILSNTKNLRKSYVYDFIKPWLRTGLLTSFGQKWKTRRRILTPAYHFNILKNFVPAFERQSELTVQDIKSECQKDETDVVPIVIEHTLNSLCETAMGTELDRTCSKLTKYKAAINQFGYAFASRLSRPWLYIEAFFALSSSGNISRTACKILHHFTQNVVQERMENWGDKIKPDVTTASGKKILPMLDLLIGQMKESGDIDYEGICEEVDTFMFEGHDTTSMNLSLLLMLLANNPEAQDKIVAEQKDIFGDSKRAATYDELMQMEYLDMCIKEGLRLYPSVPIIARELDFEVKLKDYVIPAGVQVMVLIYDLHRNSDYWANPEKFDPDRFSPENCLKRHPFAYIPFSAGSRNCIGQKFAVLEIKSFVSNVLRSYILEPIDTPESIVMKFELVVRPKHGVKVKFTPRV